MKKSVAFLHKPPIVALATLITIVGFFLKFPEKKRPFYTTQNSFIDINRVNKKFSTNKLELSYLSSCQKSNSLNTCTERRLQRITVTRMMLWNGGRRKIDKTDIEDNPLKIISTGNSEILNTALINTSNSNSNVKIDKDNNIYFSFLEARDGFVVEVLHTGESENDISIEGYIEESLFKGKFKYVERSELYSPGDYLIITSAYVSCIIISFWILSSNSSQITNYLRENKINTIVFYIIFQAFVTSVSFIIPMIIWVAIRENSTPYFYRVPNSSYEALDTN